MSKYIDYWDYLPKDRAATKEEVKKAKYKWALKFAFDMDLSKRKEEKKFPKQEESLPDNIQDITDQIVLIKVELEVSIIKIRSILERNRYNDRNASREIADLKQEIYLSRKGFLGLDTGLLKKVLKDAEDEYERTRKAIGKQLDHQITRRKENLKKLKDLKTQKSHLEKGDSNE